MKKSFSVAAGVVVVILLVAYIAFRFYSSANESPSKESKNVVQLPLSIPESVEHKFDPSGYFFPRGKCDSAPFLKEQRLKWIEIYSNGTGAEIAWEEANGKPVKYVRCGESLIKPDQVELKCGDQGLGTFKLTGKFADGEGAVNEFADFPDKIALIARVTLEKESKNLFADNCDFSFSYGD